MERKKTEQLLADIHSEDSNRQNIALMEIKEKQLTEFVSEILPLIESQDDFIRGRVAEILGLIGGNQINEVGPKLILLLSDPSDFVRNFAAEALGMLPYPPAVESLVDRLLDPEEDRLVLICAAEALGCLDDPKAIAPLLFILQQAEEDEIICAYAASSLGFLGNETLIPTLRKLLDQETSDRVKVDLLFSCIRLGDQESISLFQTLLAGADSFITSVGVHTLSLLLDYKPTPFVLEHEEELVEILTKLKKQNAHFFQKELDTFHKNQQALLPHKTNDE